MSKVLVSEREIRELIHSGKKVLQIPTGGIVTPLAAEIASRAGITIAHSSPLDASSGASKKPTPLAQSATETEHRKVVAFGSDHGGYRLKEDLKKYAESLGYKALDLGTNSEESCDYPDFAYAVARAVSAGEAWRGVMIDGAGIGSCVVANKVPGIRAACCHTEFVARNAREHNDTNLLTLGSRITGPEVCKEILRVWLETWFAGGRHKSRVEKIIEVERRFFK
ncbi:MAG TPA: ribose 5-phosphate isomerase B [Bacteroidota bacterium]|nr:ribose 5-phosphate isomerase B [Bacteroidota bacterium]